MINDETIGSHILLFGELVTTGLAVVRPVKSATASVTVPDVSVVPTAGPNFNQGKAPLYSPIEMLVGAPTTSVGLMNSAMAVYDGLTIPADITTLQYLLR